MRFQTYRHLARVATVGGVVLSVSALVACGGPKKEEGQAPAESTAPSEQQAAPAPVPEAAPAPAAPAETGPITVGDAARGKMIYDTYCVTCHRPTGKGDGPAAATLPKKPANHSDGNFMNPL